MEKITKSTDTVLIDPNEPLILPDGTALVGRIEWFLYALCCLDYQNLPTPMSRIEEFANALITGEIPNIEPQSRAEQFFLAILDGNVSNLPQPQSRSEVLLDKLARGEFDLSDVEPIQSRYELLLAYLIKNGGIGNIDYVLYEFSEAMKTMYNTVEKPFKSLELSGNTLVNCVLEDTENDDYTSFDKDYSGTSFTINGTSEGAIKSAILRGQTLVNVDSCYTDNDFITFDNATIDSDGWITVTANGNYLNTFPKMNNLIKPSTKYLAIVEIKENTLDGKFMPFTKWSEDTCFTTNFLDMNNGNSWFINENAKGVFKSFMTTEDDITNANILERSYVDVSCTTGFITYRTMLIEYQQGMENWDIPFFRGMQSTKMPVLTTIGKNLFDGKLIRGNISGGNGEDINNAGFESKMCRTNYIKVTPGSNFTASIEGKYVIEKISQVDKDKKFIATTEKNTSSVSIKLSNNTSFIRCVIKSSDSSEITLDDVRNSNVQFEESPTKTSYEPHKTNILTTTSKNLFDMNRPYDAITDSQATVVQDTNKITVSSAESGIYVNANFILDKDFFAGKTVTGSCLYESDEKDIGTVQIHYQDGNGEHHYQWIRTPKTFTFPNSFIGDVMLSVSANNTGTPQSNTVTVKNIQLELGSTATSYEPYSEGVTLRGIGDVKDELNLLTGEVVERIGEIVLDGSEEWKTDINGAGVRRYFLEGVGGDLSDSISNSSSLLCDKFKASSNIWTETNDGTQIVKSNGVYFIDSSVDSLDMFVNKLKTTNIRVQYSLIEKTVKTVDLNVVDQNNTKIDKMYVFNEVTHVNASSDGLTPTVNIGKSVSYPTIIKPNTKYTVDLKRNDKPLTVNLGGTEVTFTSGETRKTITTPSTLTNDKLSYYGVGAKCNEIMLIEGEIERNVDYFTGMQSVVMQNQMPILSTVGKNLFDGELEKGYIDGSGGYGASSTAVRSINYISVKPNTNYIISSENYTGSVYIHEYDVNHNHTNETASKSFTTSSNTRYIKFNTHTNTNLDLTTKFQIEQNTQSTTYEAYKSSILSCNDDVTLCGIGEVKDELNPLTSELTQHIKEFVLNGSESGWFKSSSVTSDGGYRYALRLNDGIVKDHAKIMCDKFVQSENAKIGYVNYLVIDNGLKSALYFNSTAETVDEWKAWLVENNVKVQYQLATESIRTVDLNVVDQDGNTIPKIKSYKDVTHLEITVPKQSLLPHISAEVATDNSKDMSSLTTKHQEISETQSAIQDNIQSQSDEIDTALMATTEIFESILE